MAKSKLKVVQLVVPRQRSLTVKPLAIEKLIPYARNARTHSDDQVAQIAGSIREFGWTNPVLIDEKCNIIAGHGRVLAARQLGMKTIPTITLTGLSALQRRALALGDNKIPLNAGWDVNLLAVELQSLGDFDLKTIGYTSTELAALLKTSDGDAPSELADGFAYRLIVECADEKVQADLMQRLEKEGFTCKPLVS